MADMTRDEHIENARRALAKTAAVLQAMEDKTDASDCCTACRFGHLFTEAADKLERQGEWLVRLLMKRPEGIAEARALCVEHELGRGWCHECNGPLLICGIQKLHEPRDAC